MFTWRNCRSFQKRFFWPDLNHNNLTNKNFSYIQSYSNKLLKEILQDQKLDKSKIENKYISFKAEDFFSLKVFNKIKKPSCNIGYITQSNNNLLLGFNRNFNDPFNLYKVRTNLLNQIIDKENNYKLLISSTEKNNDYLFDNNLLKRAQSLKKIQIFDGNAINVMKKSNIIILEQPSTTLIEALFLDVSKIFVLNNPLWRIKKSRNSFKA